MKILVIAAVLTIAATEAFACSRPTPPSPSMPQAPYCSSRDGCDSRDVIEYRDDLDEYRARMREFSDEASEYANCEQNKADTAWENFERKNKLDKYR